MPTNPDPTPSGIGFPVTSSAGEAAADASIFAELKRLKEIINEAQQAIDRIEDALGEPE